MTDGFAIDIPAMQQTISGIHDIEDVLKHGGGFGDQYDANGSSLVDMAPDADESGNYALADGLKDLFERAYYYQREVNEKIHNIGLTLPKIVDDYQKGDIAAADQIAGVIADASTQENIDEAKQQGMKLVDTLVGNPNGKGHLWDEDSGLKQAQEISAVNEKLKNATPAQRAIIGEYAKENGVDSIDTTSVDYILNHTGEATNGQ
jgi:hypothetical protein